MLTLIIGGAALYFSKEETKQREDQESGLVYLNSLSQRLNDIATINIQQKNEKSTVKLIEERWVLAEKDNYPADFSKIKKLLLELNNLKTFEAKTSKPESYGRLGVQKFGEPGEVDSVLIELFDKANNKIESVLIGKTKPATIRGGKSSIYVRKTNEAKSWLVSGSLELPNSQGDWLDKSIIDINADKIKSIEIRHSDKSRISLAKETEKDTNFKVLNLPKGASLKSESATSDISRGLQKLVFTDVLPRQSFILPKESAVQVDFQQFDGLTIKVKLVEKEDKHFILLDTHAMVDDSKVKEQAVELGSHFAQWAFEIAEFKAEPFKQKMKDLIEVKDKE